MYSTVAVFLTSAALMFEVELLLWLASLLFLYPMVDMVVEWLKSTHSTSGHPCNEG